LVGARPGHRRPIAWRELTVFNRLAAWLADRSVTANSISVTGVLCGLGAGAALWATAHTQQPALERILWLAAAVLIPTRLLANMLDGMVATHSGNASTVGELYNDVPDRVSDAAILIGLGYSAGGSPELGFAAACLAITTAYVRCLGRALGAGSDFRGPMAKQQRMAVVTGTALFMAVAPAQWRPTWFTSETSQGLGVAAGALVVINVGCVVTCVRRLSFIVARIPGATA